MAAPIVIQDCVAIRGGYNQTDKPICLAYERGEGKEHEKGKFIALASQNKDLMTAVLPKKARPRNKPEQLMGFPDGFAKHLQQLRDDYVDRLLVQHLLACHPMGASDAAHLPKDAKRQQLFKEAGVPKIITIHVDEIHEQRAIIAPRQALTLSSSDRRSSPVKIQLNENILTWLGHAMRHSWDDAAADEEDAKLHDIIHSHLKNRLVCTVKQNTVILKNRFSRQQLTIPRSHFQNPENRRLC